MKSRVLPWLLASLAAASCKPDLDETVSIVTQPRVLAVQSTPADAAPKDAVTFTALVVDANGPLPSPGIAWEFCNARNPLANLGPVNTECLQPADPNLLPIGSGPRASGVIPDVACRQFGPEVPQAMGNQPTGRPVDPDATGGYYQPVSLFVPTTAGLVGALYSMRIQCGLASGTSDQSNDYLARYHANANPAVASLTPAGAAPFVTDQGGASNTVSAGQKLQLEVAWPTCPLSDACGDGVCGADESLASCPADCKSIHGCTGAERYVTFDLGSQSLVDAREGMHVSWFATAGAFDLDRTGRDGADGAVTSDDGWQAPSQPGPVFMWIVLHDDRGGIGWGEYRIDVQ